MGLAKCACIDTLYTELPWRERFAAAKKDGFSAVEFWDWRCRDLEEIRREAEKADIVISGFNGDADYSLVDPEQKTRYLEALELSVKAAKKTGARSLTIHSNALGEGGVVLNSYDNLSHTVKLCAMYDTLLACARMAEREQINLNLEALNITTDHAGNFLVTTQMGAEICRLIGSPRLKLLYDVYHMQLNEGSLATISGNTAISSATFMWRMLLAAMSRVPGKSIILRYSGVWKSADTGDLWGMSFSPRRTQKRP